METIIAGIQKIEISEVKRMKYCYPGQSLQEVLDSITDAAADNTYIVLIFPGAIIKDAQRKDFVAVGFHGPAHDIVISGYCQLDLQGITITGINAPGVDFRDSILSAITVLGGDMSGSTGNANEAYFSTFRVIDFSSCNFDSIAFNFSKFLDCVFSNASFVNNYCPFAHFINCNFGGCDLSGTNFTDAVIDGSDFTGANLTDVVLPAYAATKANFKAAVGAGHWDAVTTIWTDGNPIG